MGIFDVGPLELIVIFVVALLVFGPNRLPEFMGQLGRWVRTVRRLSDDVTREFVRELNLDEAKNTPYTYQPPVPPPPPYYPPISEPASPPTPSAEGEASVPTASAEPAASGAGTAGSNGPREPRYGAHLDDEEPDGLVPYRRLADSATLDEQPEAHRNGASPTTEPVADPSAMRASP
jgi:Tat protein translocase TatB subunit